MGTETGRRKKWSHVKKIIMKKVKEESA